MWRRGFRENIANADSKFFPLRRFWSGQQGSRKLRACDYPALAILAIPPPSRTAPQVECGGPSPDYCM
jgi:hypothetical protein